MAISSIQEPTSMSKKKNSIRPIFSFSRKLFISVILLFWAFVAIFIAYQYSREKSFKIELLNNQLQDFNYLFNESINPNVPGKQEYI